MASATPIVVQPRPSATSPRLPRRLVFRLALAAILALFAWTVWHILWGGNVHVVVPGKVYRGAQPSAARLQGLVTHYGIRTIVNLRGGCYPQEWYLDEARAAQALGLNLEDLSFSAGRTPSHHEIRQLVEVLDRAEYPLFLHCRQGADRTGVASAIALLLHTETPYPQARRQLGLRFGHMPVGRSTILDDFFDEYESWLRQTNRTHDSAAIRHWLVHQYRGGICHAAIEEVVPLQPVARVGTPLAWRVRVRNASSETWHFRATRCAGIHLSYTLWDPRGVHLVSDRAALLDQEVAPGACVTVTVAAAPVAVPGRYRLLIDLVEEGHCHFFQAGSQPFDEEFDVRE